MIKKPLFTRFENCDPTPKRRISAPSGRGHLWPQSKRIRRWKKFRNNTVVSEKIGVKDFSLGVISPLTGGKLTKRKVVSYMGASVLKCQFSKKVFLCVTFLRTFDDVINFRGKWGEPKIGSVLLIFSLNVMSKFRVPEMTFRGQFWHR